MLGAEGGPCWGGLGSGGREERPGFLPGCRQVGSCREFHSCCSRPFQVGHGVETGKLQGAEEWGWCSALAQEGDEYWKPWYLRIVFGTW